MILQSRCKHPLDTGFHQDGDHLEGADLGIHAGATREDFALPPIELWKYQFFAIRVLLSGQIGLPGRAPLLFAKLLFKS